MKNYRTILGLPDSASADEIKATYRRLAMKHHPDRGGDNATFQAISEAYRELENSGFAAFVPPRAARQPPQSPGGTWRDPANDVKPNPGWAKPESPSGTWRDQRDVDSTMTMDEILAAMKAQKQARPNYNYVQPNSEVIMDVSLRQAAQGFEWRISRQKQNGFVEHLDVVIPPGLPDGHRGRYTLSDGSTQILSLHIEAGKYRLRGLSKTVGTIFEAGITTGDVEIDIELDSIDLITGTWFEIEDFFGERLTVRVPSGFNPDQRLKVAGKGYFGWNEEQATPGKYRRDMYIKIRPVYNPPEKISREKVLKLYNAVGGWEENESAQS